MELTERVQRLQRESKKAIPTLDPERALLLTRFYQGEESEGLSIPVHRARAFEYILLNKKISIADDELLVGEKAIECDKDTCCISNNYFDLVKKMREEGRNKYL